MTPPIVLGFAGCVDYELTLTEDVLHQLIRTYRIRDAELTSMGPVSSERDLVISILSYVRRGGGGEHYVVSPQALSAFAERLPRRTTLGGTSVRAGLTMSRLGVPSTLHLVSVNDVVRSLLPPGCGYIGGSGQDPVYPHLIVQYDRGLRVRSGDIDIQAPFPNRLIYVHDPANELLPLSDDLAALLPGAHVLLISGFNVIRDESVLHQRLSALQAHLRRLAPSAFVYYEDAAFHVPAFSTDVRQALLDAVDVFGLNEDELHQHLGFPTDLLSVTEVEHALHALRTLLPAPTVVLHTKHWAAAAGDRAREYAAALEEGITIASTRYAYGDGHTDEDHHAMRRQPRDSQAAQFAAALEAQMGSVVCCRPGPALDVAHPTTVGLGDTFVGGFLAEVSRKRTDQWS